MIKTWLVCPICGDVYDRHYTCIYDETVCSHYHYDIIKEHDNMFGCSIEACDEMCTFKVTVEFE